MQSFAYWDDIEIVQRHADGRLKSALHRIGGNAFYGCSRRILLLR
jgi:hypothetical protein